MATRIELFSVTTPSGVGVSAFQRTSLPFNDGDVTRVELRIPPGPSGLLGFRLAHSGQSVVPATGNEWIVADNEAIDWPLDGFPGNSGWELWTYNDDVWPHTVYVRFHVTDDSGFVPVTIAPLNIVPLALSEIEPPSELEVF